MVRPQNPILGVAGDGLKKVFLDKFSSPGLEFVYDNVLWTEAIIEGTDDGGVSGVVTLEIYVGGDGGSERADFWLGRFQALSALPDS